MSSEELSKELPEELLTRPEAVITKYDAPAGGRGAVKSSLVTFYKQGITFKVLPSFANANKPGGFDCPGCAFPDKNESGFGPDSCEQGQKAIAWEMTHKEAGVDFFQQKTLSELRLWTDFDLVTTRLAGNRPLRLPEQLCARWIRTKQPSTLRDVPPTRLRSFGN